MAKADVYLEYLRKEGYFPEVDEDGDIMFKREGRVYYMQPIKDDAVYFSLWRANFWSLETPAEKDRALVAAAKTNLRFKVVKVFPTRDMDDMHCKVEMFCNPIENFQPVFMRCLDAMSAAVQEFAQIMRGEKD